MLKEAREDPPLELFSTGLPTPWFCISGLQTYQGIVSLKTQTWLWLPVLNTSNSTDVCCWSWPSQGSRSFLQSQTHAHWVSSNLRLPLGAAVSLFLFFSYQVMSDSLQLHGRQHARLPCPSPSPRVYPSSCPLNRCCHPTISSSVALFSSCPQSFPASGSFPMSRLLTSGGQSIGALASASALPMSILGWFPLRLTGLIYLLSKGVKSLLQHRNSKASILRCSAFFMVQMNWQGGQPFHQCWLNTTLPTRAPQQAVLGRRGDTPNALISADSFWCLSYPSRTKTLLSPTTYLDPGAGFPAGLCENQVQILAAVSITGRLQVREIFF